MKAIHALFDWANANEGVISLFALAVALPTLAILLWNGYRRWFPARRERESQAKEEFERAAALMKEVQEHARWEERGGYYGEFLIRDTARKLPETDEAHSSVTTPYSIAVLTRIHTEYLEFTTGSFSRRSIRQVNDYWCLANDDEEDAVRVQIVFRINYRDIVTIRWETNEYWEWPQVCCRFTKSNKFPLSHVYYAREEVIGDRHVLIDVCPVDDVRRRVPQSAP